MIVRKKVRERMEKEGGGSEEQQRKEVKEEIMQTDKIKK